MFFKRYSDRLLKKRLANLPNPKDIPRFSFEGLETYARVVSVYDGDTITIVFEYHKQMIKYSCRIYGIDTPEIRTSDPEEKKLGFAARDYLRSIILDKVVKVNFMKFDKYGRILITLSTTINNEPKDISNLMIAEGYAKPYFGGKK